MGPEMIIFGRRRLSASVQADRDRSAVGFSTATTVNHYCIVCW
jgi:hypothetical protein